MRAKTVQDFGAGPVLMGVLNVTPDSFSDGGFFANKNNALDHAMRLVQHGAHIIDIGGESTRPGAEAVEIQKEIDRTIPVVEDLAKEGVLVSIDTRNAATMRAALDVGAWAINDISALTYDPESVLVAQAYQCPVFLMHMQGSPQTMQKNPSYNNVVEDVFEYLKNRIEFCDTYGIDNKNIIIDVGIGFGKLVEDNLLLLRNISKFHDLGCPQLLGTSRKSFIGKLSNDDPADQRLGGSLSSVLWGLSQGVQFFRIHDVRETAQAFKIYEAITSV